MSNPLATYVEDHLGGATHAVDLLKHLRDRHEGEALGGFSARMLVEIQADFDTLEEFGKQVGAKSGGFKAFAGWASEKMARLKTTQDADGLGTFEALEFLAVGIQGKLALWRALSAADEGRLDLSRLIARGEAQFAEVEQRRLETARQIFRATPAR